MQIPFYHFCTVCCTRDLILLLDRREGSILFFFGWWFHGAGFSGCPKERCVARAGPPAAPSAPSHSHTWGTAWRGPPEAMQSAVNSQGSCFLSCCHSLFVRRAVGHSPSPLFTPSVRNENHRRTFLGWGSLFPAFFFLLLFLNQNQVYSQSVPLPQVPKRWPLHRAVQLLHLLAPHPGASCCFRQWYFVICLVPRLHGSVTGFRSLWVCSLSLPLSHSLSLSKVCDFKQLLLISVSHWCRSFLYCKETYLRLLIAVWFRVFPQTPFVLWDQ